MNLLSWKREHVECSRNPLSLRFCNSSRFKDSLLSSPNICLLSVPNSNLDNVTYRSSRTIFALICQYFKLNVFVQPKQDSKEVFYQNMAKQIQTITRTKSLAPVKRCSTYSLTRANKIWLRSL